MRVCDVVLNSVWYDPRVRKQIISYLEKRADLSCVGLKCDRFDQEKIQQIPCKTTVVQIPAEYDGKQNSVLRKLKREQLRICGVRDAIIAEKPEIIHANDLNALIPAYLAKRKLKCRLIYDSHEVYVENYTTTGRARIAELMKRLEKFLIRKCDQMVCVSHAAADYFAQTYNMEKPMVVSNCSLKNEMMCNFDGEKNPGFEVLNHGRYYEGRGYELMAEACGLIADMSDVRLAVRGYGRIEDQMRKTVEQFENRDQFIFYPPVLVQELISTAAKSHVGVAVTLPVCLNFKLSVSNKLFEYASAGLPVILSDIPEHRYLNERYHFGVILEENTPECFVAAVKKLHDDKALYEQCAQNAKHMTEEMTWENEFEHLYIRECELLATNK